MFEIAELGHQVKKEDYKKRVPELRTELLIVQQQLLRCDFPVLILISGVDGGGKGDVINLLNEWLDSRLMRTNAFDEPSDEERERPKFWRFWRTLPERGKAGIYVGSWYSEPLSKHAYQDIDDAQLQKELKHINQLEKQLIDDGALIIKCWLHLNKQNQKKRLKALEDNSETAWKVTKKDKKHLAMYEQFMETAEAVLTETSTGQCPWLVVDGSNLRYSSLTVGEHILKRIKQQIEHTKVQQEKPIPEPEPTFAHLGQKSLLDALDLTLTLEKKEYTQQLQYYQGLLNKLGRQAKAKKMSAVLVFEGWDAGGKGGAIRRITHALDARNYQVISIAAPTDEEKQHHYLWRFWRHIPRAGKATIYDRSWYGRVLVERVEKFTKPSVWMRAYSEIVNFEEALTEHGILVLKFWLHIDQHEQLRRFKEREQISYKKHKITEEDYRNREKWQDYVLAVNEMVMRTSTRSAPWILIEGNDKRFARVKVLQAICEALQDRLDQVQA